MDLRKEGDKGALIISTLGALAAVARTKIQVVPTSTDTISVKMITVTDLVLWN